MIEYQDLVAMAKDKPKRHPEVRQMLIRWMHETEVRDRHASSAKFLEVALRHTIAKYQLGFLSEEDALFELQEIYDGLTSDPTVTSALMRQWLDTVKSIKDGSFKVV